MPAPIECSGILKTSENRSRQNSRQTMKTETKKWPPKNRKPLGYKEKSSDRSRSFLSMGYDKDVFCVFAYEFELLQYLAKSFANAHGEIIYFVNCEI